jgi:16S rRNA (guanine(966)-N(2))-methyltransferase RsmD
MRIISGQHKGRILRAPSNFKARPTTDFAKEAIFNVMESRFDISGIEALDMFAGGGGIGFEFASRGAQHVDCVECNANYCANMRNAAQAIGLAQVNIICCDAFAYLLQCQRKYDIIFADPPYILENMQRLPDMVFGRNLLKDNGWLILEHGSRSGFEQHEKFLQHRRYGSVNFSIFAAC